MLLKFIMIHHPIEFTNKLLDTIKKAQSEHISEERINVLNPLISYLLENLESKNTVNLNFICTHNSRRSQFSQIWAFTASKYFEIPVNCYSGGVEVTEFNPRAVESLVRSGFKVKKQGDDNPEYRISIDIDELCSITTYSKLFNDPSNATNNFVAVMTCSHADENCPIIPGADLRIPIRYEDPKSYDNTPEEESMYDARSLQIASEMFYIFSKVKKLK